MIDRICHKHTIAGIHEQSLGAIKLAGAVAAMSAGLEEPQVARLPRLKGKFLHPIHHTKLTQKPFLL